MAYIAASAIKTALREVLQSEAGLLRQITEQTYEGDLPEELTDAELSRRGVTARIEANLNNIRRSPSSPPIMGNLTLYQADVVVRVVRTLDRMEQSSDCDRDAAMALVILDCDILAQALTFPHNLLTTEDGTATGIVSGCLSYVDSNWEVRGAVDDGASVIETIHRYTCTIKSSPSTT